MKYAYEDLSDAQFENLIILLCQELFGVAVKGFAAGPDGGRDAKFVGTALLFPSEADPWVGTTIIQAKHTLGSNRSFSEKKFYSDASEKSTIGEELPRIRKLRDSGELDHYMLFANRRLTGNTDRDICTAISARCSIPESSIYLCGLEQLELWMKKFPNVPRLAELDPVDSPLIVSPDDLAEVIEALGKQFQAIRQTIIYPPERRVSLEEKNVQNNMTAEFASEQRKRFLADTAVIEKFLANPENESLQQLYESAAYEFQFMIIAKRKEYQTFDDVLVYLNRLLTDRDPVLRQREHKKLVRAMLFYMYWNCDIGNAGDD